MCVGPMLSLAMIGDVFENSEATKMLLLSLWPPPIVGPLLGGTMLEIGNRYFGL